MATVKPFRALCPEPSRAQKLASVPYDVVSTPEARTLAEGNPDSFLRVVRSEVELDASVDPYSPAVYHHAKAVLERLLAAGVLIKHQSESLYLYRLQTPTHTQTGIFGCLSVDDYESGVIRIHEKTRPDKEDDRVRHITTLHAHAEPVLLAYRSQHGLRALVKLECERPPLLDFTADDGVRHVLWRAQNTAAIVEAFQSVPALYIADGHHRAAAACRTRAHLREANRNHSGKEEYNFFPGVVFPHDELQILPYNRIVRRMSLEKEDLLEKLEKSFTVRRNGLTAPQGARSICFYCGGEWIELVLKPSVQLPASAVDRLDVSLLFTEILKPHFGIEDPRTDTNLDFVGGKYPPSHLKALVDAGKAACAFSLFPVTLNELFEVSDAGNLMPPKSTWFEPKLRSGLAVHQF